MAELTVAAVAFGPIEGGLFGSLILKSQAPPHRQGDQGDERFLHVENSLAVRAHDQNPKSIEKKKLRLGGNGATSMFRMIA